MSFFGFGKKDKNNDKDGRKPSGEVKKKSYDIICPYCFNIYGPNEVVFRVNHDKKNDDRFKLQSDSKLNDYRRSIGLEELTEIQAVLDPNSPDDLKYIKKKNDQGGILLGITDSYGQETKKRLCPHCHKEIPITAGRGPTEVISLIGATSVGKTIYMTVLLKTLQAITAGNFRAGCIPIASLYLDVINENEEMIYFHKEVLPPNPKGSPIEPLILTFNFKDDRKPSLTLIFYDVAGEGMNDPEYIEKHAPHIKNSTGIMFLIDPLQIRAIDEKLRIINDIDDSIDLANNSNFANEKVKLSRKLSSQDIITKLFENFIGSTHNQKTNIPTSVIISKSDMLRVLEGTDIRKSSNIFKSFKHKGFLSLDQISLIDKEVEDFLKEVDGAFVNSMDSFFSEKRYFAISALGSNPVNKKIQGIISPMRIDEPFLWLLYKWGYIDAERYNGV